MHTIRWVRCLLAALLLAKASGASRAEEGKDFVVFAGEKSTPFVEMIAELSRADVVIVGENHDHRQGHLLEAEILKALHARRAALSLSLEMFERDVQGVLNEYLEGYITESAFLQAARPWPNYKEDYRPLIEYCREQKLPVVAANAPRRYVNIVSRKGQQALQRLPRSARAYLAPLPFSLEIPDGYAQQLDRIFVDSHGSSSSGAPSMTPAVANLKEAQYLWDATMADSILRARRSRRGALVLQMNGCLHSDAGFGIADRLRKADPRCRVRIVSIKPDAGFPGRPAGQPLGIADYLVLTPMTSNRP